MMKRLSLFSCLAAAMFVMAQAAPPLPAQGGPGNSVLLLANGRVIHGKVTEEGDRFYVTLPSGEIRLRAADVDFVGRDLKECYRHKRARMIAGSASDHLSLAGWCLSNRLFDEAALELRAAASLEPGHPRLPLLERRLKLARSEPAARPRDAKPAGRSPPRREELAEMTRDLSPAVVETFTARIQPLLQNSCAAASCHGPRSSSRFTLLRLPRRRVATQRFTQRNLYAVLELIDRNQPAASPLLNVPAKPHGSSQQAVFKDLDSRAYRTLVAWVRLVAESSPPPADSRAPRPSPPPTSETPTGDSANKTPDNEAPPSSPPDPPPALAPRDPFDPEVFNRRYQTSKAKR